MATSLSSQEKTLLLALAHDAIAAHLLRQPRPSLPQVWKQTPSLQAWEIPENSLLYQQVGVFVSVYIEQELRGCIGTFSSDHPLWKNVQQMAVQAATRDPRFVPIHRTEQDHLHCEISVLTPPIPIEGPQDIQIGRDGLIVETPSQRGVLLPQVATQYQWDSETFLQHTCLKARLPPDAWHDSDVSLSRFEAMIVSDHAPLDGDGTCPMG